MLLCEPAMEPDESWLHAVAPPPGVVSGAGANQVGAEGLADLVDGVDAPAITGEGAIDPSLFPPVLCDGWEGEVRASEEVLA